MKRLLVIVLFVLCAGCNPASVTSLPVRESSAPSGTGIATAAGVTEYIRKLNPLSVNMVSSEVNMTNDALKLLDNAKTSAEIQAIEDYAIQTAATASTGTGAGYADIKDALLQVQICAKFKASGQDYANAAKKAREFSAKVDAQVGKNMTIAPIH